MKKILCGMAFLVLGAVGCGGDDDSGGGADAFVGTWNYTSGTSTSNCGGQSETEQLSGSTTFMKGVAAPLVAVSDGCTMNLDITGNTAAIRGTQECTSTRNGATATLKVTAYTFTVNGLVADESGSATLNAVGPGGTVNCTITQSGKLMKISK